jgi:hypothetical protein
MNTLVNQFDGADGAVLMAPSAPAMFMQKSRLALSGQSK